MEINYQHNLTQEQAYSKINEFLSELQQKYANKISDPIKKWNSAHTQMEFGMGILGFKGIKGTIFLTQKEVKVVGKIPFLARLFSGKIEQIIKQQLEDLL